MTRPPLDIEALYRQHGHVVLRRARQLMGDDEEAREVLHDVFTSLLQRPQQFAGRSSFVTWLYSATTHRCLNRLRNRRTRVRLLEEGAPGATTSTASHPHRGEQLAMAQQLLASMPDEVAQTAVYYFFDEMNQEEIAEVIGCSRRRVGKLLEQAKHLAERQEVHG